MKFGENTLLAGLLWVPFLAACGSAAAPDSSGSSYVPDSADARVETSDLTVFSAVKVNKRVTGKVYVHVMPWFESNASSGNGRWGIHWTMSNQNPDITDGSGRRQIASKYYPLIGPYGSGDPDVIEYQLLLMKYAGIDGVLIDWPGTLNINDYPKNRQNSEAMIALTSKVGLDFGIVYEDHNVGMAADAGQVGNRIGAAQTDMAYLRDRYFPQANYVRVNNAPLLLDFGPQTFTNPADWGAIFSVLPTRPTFLTLWYQSQQAGQYGGGEFSWVYVNNDQLPPFYSRGISGVKMGSAYPGFDSFYTQGGWAGPTWTIPANGTGTFAWLLDRAVQANTGYTQLVTWNDYGEGTMIEPTREYGYGMLTTLQQKLGVPYAQSDLELAAQLFAQRKQYAGNAAKKADLDQAFYDLASLQTAAARSILNGTPPPSTPPTTPTPPPPTTSTPPPTTPTPPPTGTNYYLKNHWTGAYLSVSGTQATYASSANANAKWTLEDQSGFKRIKNVTLGCYLNIERQLAYAECSSVPSSYYSGYWTLESISGYARLKNAWKGTYLNVENQAGYAQCSAVPDYFESGQWSLVAN